MSRGNAQECGLVGDGHVNFFLRNVLDCDACVNLRLVRQLGTSETFFKHIQFVSRREASCCMDVSSISFQSMGEKNVIACKVLFLFFVFSYRGVVSSLQRVTPSKPNHGNCASSLPSTAIPVPCRKPQHSAPCLGTPSSFPLPPCSLPFPIQVFCTAYPLPCSSDPWQIRSETCQ